MLLYVNDAPSLWVDQSRSEYPRKDNKFIDRQREAVKTSKKNVSEQKVTNMDEDL